VPVSSVSPGVDFAVRNNTFPPLKASYLNLQKAITALSDNDLQAAVKLFGRDMTKQGALMLILEDQHEHLGQSIAYARSNGVVPPWSK